MSSENISYTEAVGRRNHNK